MTTQLLERDLPTTKQRYYDMPIFRLPVEPAEPMSRDGWAVSEEEYWAVYYEGSGDDYYDAQYEWNNGYLEEKSVSTYQVYSMTEWLMLALQQYLDHRPIAKLISSGTFGFSIQLVNSTTIRKPDGAVVLNSNLQKLQKKDRSYHGIFDLCIEAISDSRKRDIERDTIEKKRDYAKAGVQEYYIVDDTDKMVFYWLNDLGEYEELKGDIIRSKLLPGFQFRKADLLRQPSLTEMAEDEVYRDYVLPVLTKKKELALQRAELALKHAEQEWERAELAIRQTEQERQEKELALKHAEQEQQQKEIALQHAEQERQHAEHEQQQKEVALQHAEQERQRAEQERQQKEIALKHAEQERQRAEQEQQQKEIALQRAELLAAKLRELGINPETI